MDARKGKKLFTFLIGFLIILFILANGILLYDLYQRQELNNQLLNTKIDSLQENLTKNVDRLSINMTQIQTQFDLLKSEMGSLDKKMTYLKASASADFSGIIEDSIKSVVTIRTDTSQGTGFFIAEGGYIITNAHVIGGALKATAITYDEKRHALTTIGEDEDMDLTLLKIESEEYSPLKFGDSDDVQIGEKVIAIGNPYGLQFSVSEGIISAVHREGENNRDVYLQTDTSLNSGNSGGPLINVEGKVVGLNNFKISEGNNIGFALESNYVGETVNEIYNKVYEINLI